LLNEKQELQHLLVGTAITTDPPTNMAVGAAVAAELAHMRGGASYQITKLTKSIFSLKDFVIVVDSAVNPTKMQFHSNFNIITQNIFTEHTAKRYNSGLARKGTNYFLTVSGPVVIQASAKASIVSLIGYSFLGIGISFTIIYGGLCLIRNANNKHCEIVLQSKSNEQIIDVTYILSYLLIIIHYF
jgi:hypothetical protein